jgi:hypothetical protein
MSSNHVAISGSAAKTAPQNLFVCRAPVGEHIWNELEGTGTSFNHTFLCFGAERECGCTSRVPEGFMGPRFRSTTILFFKFCMVILPTDLN